METPTMPNFQTSGPIQFLKEVKAELNKVTWPTKQETTRFTIVVIIVSVFVAFFIGGFDALFLQLSTLLWR